MEFPGYVPQLISRSTITSIFIGAAAIVVSATWIAAGFTKKLSKRERTVMCWWMFTGLTHMILEGYYAFTPDFYRKTPPIYLDEVWKEYSKGDSRYASRNSAVVSITGLTAVLAGPLSLLCVFAVATKKSYRHVLQLAVSLEQIYVTILLFMTYSLDGGCGNLATSEFYFYGDFAFGNSIWIVIPMAISIDCWRRISEAMQEQGKGQNRETKSP